MPATEKDALVLDTALRQCVRIFNSQALLPQPDAPVFMTEACFTLLMIYLKDALAILTELDRRVAFKDDMPAVVGYGDVTDLVHNSRDPSCHIRSRNHDLDGHNNYGRFNVVQGSSPGFAINGERFLCEFSDDVAFFHGRYRIYLARHLNAHRRAAAASNITALSHILEDGHPVGGSDVFTVGSVTSA